MNKIGDTGAQALEDALKNENCKLTSLDVFGNQIGDAVKEKINFIIALCVINNLKRIIEYNEINENNYKKIVENVRSRISIYDYDKLLENWYNSLQENKKLQYLDAEYKEELADHDIETSGAAIKYIKDKFDTLDKELNLELKKKDKNFDEFINNEKLMNMLGVSGPFRQDFDDYGDFGVEV